MSQALRGDTMRAGTRAPRAALALALLAIAGVAPAALGHKGHRDAAAKETPSSSEAGPDAPRGTAAKGHRRPDGGDAESRTPVAGTRPRAGAATPAPHGAHEEESGRWPPPGVPRPLAWLGKFHPPLTHFPIALLTAALLAEILGFRRRDPLFAHAARFCVFLGGFGAVAAAVLGWFFAGFTLTDDEWVLTAHRVAGSLTAVAAAAALLLSERFHRGGGAREAYLAALSTAAALVALTGFLGGALVYGLDHYAW